APENQWRRQAELGLGIVAAATPAGAELRREALALLFDPRPQSDELIVDATRNFVLFHRRRTRRCVTLPRPAPDRVQPLRVLTAAAESVEAAAALAEAVATSAPADVAALRARLAVDAPAPAVFEFPPRIAQPLEPAAAIRAGLRALGLAGPVHAAIVAGRGAPALELARAGTLLAALPPETPAQPGLVVRPLPAVPAAAASFD